MCSIYCIFFFFLHDLQYLQLRVYYLPGISLLFNWNNSIIRLDHRWRCYCRDRIWGAVPGICQSTLRIGELPTLLLMTGGGESLRMILSHRWPFAAQQEVRKFRRSNWIESGQIMPSGNCSFRSPTRSKGRFTLGGCLYPNRSFTCQSDGR